MKLETIRGYVSQGGGFVAGLVKHLLELGDCYNENIRLVLSS